jgi:hypothetical protein
MLPAAKRAVATKFTEIIHASKDGLIKYEPELKEELKDFVRPKNCAQTFSSS